MDERVLALLVVAGGIIASQIVYLFAVTLGGTLFRIPIAVISLGVGPELVGVRVGDARLRIAAFVFSTYVKFKGGDEFDESARGALEAAPWWQKIILALVGPAAIIATAAIVLGGAAWDQALGALAIVGDLAAPPLPSIDFTGAIGAAIAERGILGAIAQVAAFNGGLQLLPLTFLAGGGSLIYLAEAFHGGPLPPVLTGALLRLSLAAAVALIILASIAIVL